MGAKALLEVEHVGHVAPENHVYHLESLPPLAALADADVVVRAVDIRVELDQLTREVVAGRAGIHEAEVHADDLAGRLAILVDERGGRRRVDRLLRVVKLTATCELFAEESMLPAQRPAGSAGRRRRGLSHGVRRRNLFADTRGHRSAARRTTKLVSYAGDARRRIPPAEKKVERFAARRRSDPPCIPTAHHRRFC